MIGKEFERTVKLLKARNLNAWFLENCTKARDLMRDLIPKQAVVGVGDSSSVRQVGIIEELRRRGTKVINPFDLNTQVRDLETYLELLIIPMFEASLCEVFLTGTNAITEDGRLVNIDGTGNRAAGMFWGHPRVIVVVGRNKIVKDLDEAFDRIKNLIVPEHMRRRGIATSCAKTGRCSDCLGKARICAVTTIIESRPRETEINVVIVDEDLGLSWDQSWPNERIANIAERHEEFNWTPARETLDSVKESLYGEGKEVDPMKLWNLIKPRLEIPPAR